MTEDFEASKHLLNTQEGLIIELRMQLEIANETLQENEIQIEKLNSQVLVEKEEKLKLESNMNEKIVKQNLILVQNNELIDELQNLNSKLTEEKLEMKDNFDLKLTTLQETILNLRTEKTELSQKIIEMKRNKYLNIINTSHAMQELRDTISMLNNQLHDSSV